jgi:hypothetical protein
MDNPEKLETLGTQETRRRQNKAKPPTTGGELMCPRTSSTWMYYQYLSCRSAEKHCIPIPYSLVWLFRWSKVRSSALEAQISYLYLLEPSCSWSYGSWIYNYPCYQCLLPLTLWVRIPLRQFVLYATLCEQVCQWLTTGRWFFPGTPVSSTNRTNRHDKTKNCWKWR